MGVPDPSLTGSRHSGARSASPISSGRDIVHWDLHSGNLLISNGSLAAVVDTDFAVVGDASFDLVTLALTSLTIPCEPGVRTRLFASALTAWANSSTGISGPPVNSDYRLANPTQAV